MVRAKKQSQDTEQTHRNDHQRYDHQLNIQYLQKKCFFTAEKQDTYISSNKNAWLVIMSI